MRAIDLVTQRHWAITPDAMQTISRVAARQHDLEKAREEVAAELLRRESLPGAIAVKSGTRIEDTYKARQRGNVAIVPVYGPIFPRANMMTDYSGATSLNHLASDINLLSDNDDITAIILDFDSPGGVAVGPAEMAEMIRAASKKKPITAYVGGYACSAAYWLASACTEIVANDAALLGSIGVVTAIAVQEEADQNGERTIEIVSSHANKKRNDPRTDDGRAEIVRQLDDLEALFIDGIAAYRGKTRDDVIKNFGSGGVLIAADAVKVGMADRIGSFENVLSELQQRSQTQPKQYGGNMSGNKSSKTSADQNNDPEVIRRQAFSAGRKDGAMAERARILGIEAVAKPGHEQLVADAKADGKSTAADVALRIVEAEKTAGADWNASTQAQVAALPAVTASPSATAPATATAEDSTLSVEERAKAEWDKDPAIREEFGNLAVFTAYMKGAENDTFRVSKVTK